jgi:hypothetical protein
MRLPGADARRSRADADFATRWRRATDVPPQIDQDSRSL